MLALDIVDDPHCKGVSFRIQDEEVLAKAVALVLLQDYKLAKAIIAGQMIVNENEVFEESEIQNIVDLRLNPTNVYHRDGFLFQLIMWLGSHHDLERDDLVAMPHAQHAEKGQDSIIVHRAEGALRAISICEDKATENPRPTIREEVWPEIKTYESGGRWDELRSKVIATLGLDGVSSEEGLALIRAFTWEGNRWYRVRVTVQQERTKHLFRGFEDLVDGGAADVRRGETVLIPNLRRWMDLFAKRVEAHLWAHVEEDE